MARRTLLRIIPLLCIVIGAIAIDTSWLFYLLRWQPSPHNPFHSMASVPVFLFIGIASLVGFCATGILRENNKFEIKRGSEMKTLNSKLSPKEKENIPEQNYLLEYHKGQFCVVDGKTFCQEGYCSDCALSKTTFQPQ